MIGLSGMRASVKSVWAGAVIVAIMLMVAGCELPGAEQTAQPATPTPAGRAMPTPTTIEVHRESYTHCTTGIAVMDEYASNDVVRWTADGSHILLTYSRAIWAVTADGSRLWRLARSWQKPLSGSDYSPGRSATFDVTTDGERVVYATCRYPPDVPRGAQSSVEWNSRFDYELAVVGLDGQGPRRLTRHPALDSYPAWSPDGTRIAFVSGRDDPDVVHGVVGPYTMAADGADVRRLAGSEGVACWSPDGRCCCGGLEKRSRAVCGAGQRRRGGAAVGGREWRVVVAGRHAPGLCQAGGHWGSPLHDRGGWRGRAAGDDGAWLGTKRRGAASAAGGFTPCGHRTEQSCSIRATTANSVTLGRASGYG